MVSDGQTTIGFIDQVVDKTFRAIALDGRELGKFHSLKDVSAAVGENYGATA